MYIYIYSSMTMDVSKGDISTSDPSLCPKLACCTNNLRRSLEAKQRFVPGNMRLLHIKCKGFRTHDP